MIGIRLFKSISCALTLTILSPLGHADEACEMFLGRALNQMFSTIESAPEQEDSELRALGSEERRVGKGCRSRWAADH